MTWYLILSFSAFFLTLLGTRLAILAARKRAPSLDHRGQVRRALPTGGGVAVVMALIICLLIADIHYAIILSLFLLAAVSLLGDIIDVPLPVRLLVHLMAVLIPISLIHTPILSDALPAWLDKTLAVALWLWFINVFNLMDGIDGITPTEMICIATGLALIVALIGTFPSPLSVYSLIVMSAACGFFWWNWYPAKILLGEVGTAPIGFLLGYLLFIAIASGYPYAAAILPAYYLSDATLTLLRRIGQGKAILVSHTEHYYQIAVRNGRRHDSVVRYIFGLNFILILLATFSVLHPALDIFYLVTAYVCTFIVLGFFAHTPHNPHHEPF